MRIISPQSLDSLPTPAWSLPLFLDRARKADFYKYLLIGQPLHHQTQPQQILLELAIY